MSRSPRFERAAGVPAREPAQARRAGRDSGDLVTYVRELHKAGLHEVRGELIAGAGHYCAVAER